ncbi:hypothetical protein GP475_00895 [Corynebacterium poyangense]|uniref:Uncharacterized protein n=1 Tax=Corynebacterium poyangense TaxID=2684405 RepID=A0A7H0SLC6_9CORY|nr:hypothetical protein [Corynebacterium poyangense]MBZ8177440.1 hypothetical protein [Corynebacterium poyangense]QNQ89351.1 hypothetical protein GP475_00895 [Corynebacterium poyangense]
MFGLFKKKDTAPEEHIAAQRTDLPLNDFMTRLMAQELPLLDSVSRGEVYQILRDYEGEQICQQDQLPERIRELMDL